MQFRVHKLDSKNWVIEEFVTGGINRKTGEQADDHWRIVGYYGKLKDLVVYLLDKSIVLPDRATGEQILEAVREAEKNILNQLSAVPAEMLAGEGSEA